MVAYWENPADGQEAPHPKLPIDTWAARRAGHLAEEIVRAGNEVLAARASVDTLVEKMAQHQAKLDSAARLQGAAEEHWKALRLQAAQEFNGEDFQLELASAESRLATTGPLATPSDLRPMPVVKRHWWSRRKFVVVQDATADAEVAEVSAEGN